jgi:serine/threonine protein phosphatase PrpC
LQEYLRQIFPWRNSLRQEDEENTVPIDRLISKHFAPRAQPVEVDFGALSHVGKVRKNNEDHYLVARRRRSMSVLESNLPEGYLPDSVDDAYVMFVADGLGGEASGELASMLALRTAWDLSLSEIKWTLKLGEREVEEAREKVDLYFRLIDRALIQEGRAKPQTTGMGTTLTLVYTVGSNAFVCHVGDSRVYLYRGGALRQVTRDHTVAQRLVDAGVVTPGAIAASSFRNMLTNCIGCSKEGVDVDVSHIRLEDGDRLLLCSDGLTDMVKEDSISEVLNAYVDLQDTAQALVDRALDKGGKDNVTVVLARYKISAREGERTTD